MNRKKLATLAIATIVGGGLSLGASTAIAGKHKKDMVKCFGVAKKAKNDCGTAKHSCAGQAKTDNDPGEWVFMSKPQCEKIGGSVGKTAKPKNDDKKS